MTPSTNARRLSGGLLVCCLLLAGLLAWNISATLHTIHTTGILAVNTSEPSAAITISQINHSAAPIGIGSARIRLQPGDYLLGANAAGLSAVQTVHVSAQRDTTVTLNLAKSSGGLPSVDDVGFVNTDILVDDGLTSTQLTSVKEQFFTYDTAAKVVSLDAGSIQPGPHDPNSYDPFTLNFTGTIDSKPFQATVAYVGYDHAQLTLSDPQTGDQLYVGPGLPAN